MSDDTLQTRDTPPDPPPSGQSSNATPKRQRIGQYEIRAIIASGGMGVVYEAWQQSPRRAVALKVMRLGLESPSARERFEREAQLLARLHHPGIVQVYEAGTHQEGSDQTPFIAMEFIPGARTITQFAAAKSLNPRQIAELLCQACGAVHHGNEKSIIHRDLKPSNLLVDQDGCVKVIDFGVARALDSDIAQVTLQTHIGQLVGTVHYMSPEQIGGDSRSLDARTDVYSLGVVLFELLSGSLPFDLRDKSLADASRIVQTEPARKLSALAPNIDPSLETIVTKATSKDRADRYATVRDLADDLSRWLGGEEIHARRAGPFAIALRAARRHADRNRPAASLLIAIIATLIGWFSSQFLINHIPPFTPIAVRLQRTASAGTIENFQNVKAIVINRDDGTLTAETDAAAAGIAGVSNQNVRSWRLLHAALMKKLSSSGASALAFDIHFAGTDPLTDNAMIEGIAACKNDKLPLILFRPHWPQNADHPIESSNRILISPDITIGVGVGSEGSGAVDHIAFANQRGDKDPWPSLALATWSAAELGRSPIQYSYDLINLRVSAASREPSSTSIGRIIRKMVLPATSIQAATTSKPQTQVQAGDLIALLSFSIPTATAVTQATHSMSDVLKMNDSQLRDTFRGQVVLVADAARDSKVILRDGQTVRGYVIHMAAMEGLSRNPGPRLVGDSRHGLLIVLASACAGVVLGFAGRKLCAMKFHLLTILMTTFLSGVAALAVCYMCPGLFGLIVHPLAPGIAAATAAGFLCLMLKPWSIP